MVRSVARIFDKISSVFITPENALETVRPRTGEWSQASKQQAHWWLSALKDGTSTAWQKPYTKDTLLGFKTCEDVMDSVIMLRKVGYDKPVVMGGVPWNWGTRVDDGVAQKGRFTHALFENNTRDGDLLSVNLTEAGRKLLSGLDKEFGPIDVAAEAEEIISRKGYRRHPMERLSEMRAIEAGHARDLRAS